MVYPREAVVAEKFHAMVILGIANSRMRDFFDIWFLSQRFAFSGTRLCSAIQATFDRRKTRLPVQTPVALTSEFYEDPGKQRQWQAFLKRAGLYDQREPLNQIAESLQSFLLSPIGALLGSMQFKMTWPPTGPWH
ncbi:MAG: nucleotidyl transferase AbiEii/AbiGii toxin family protein [Acidobacteria bacterium]|nr:nucleotidyl transferase AbiEii/AbiGii toxin family protein [Acidobacteriota bacterium]